ncbi:chromate transporter [Bacteroidia bacterium]|nr:chromate transporter [Bacteroidia bacterium]
MSKSSNIRKFKQSLFLRDVLILSLTAFGGPQVHFIQFIRRFCEQRRYVSKEELIELYSFCQILPGPTSTQTITTLGFKLGSYPLAILTILIWILPATILMSIFVLAYSWMQASDLLFMFKFVPAMAVGFLFGAGFKMIPLIKKQLGFYIICGLACLAVVLNHWYAINAFTSSIILPLILFVSAYISQKYINRDFISLDKPLGKVNYKHLVIIGLIFFAFVIVGNAFRIKEVLLFENTFRMGSLVFGGGQVLVPMMEAQFVHAKGYLTATEFANGYGLLQAVPGPVFSFSTFVNGMALQEKGPMFQLLGCAIGSIGIFLPGLLIMFFVYPIWGRIKSYPIIQRSMDGIVAAAVGLIIASAIIIFFKLFAPDQIDMGQFQSYLPSLITMLITIGLVVYSKLPSPFIVILTILAGFLL